MDSIFITTDPVLFWSQWAIMGSMIVGMIASRAVPWFARRARRRALLRSPGMGQGSTEGATARLYGRARANAMLTAPCSGRRVMGYRAVLEAKYDARWENLIDEIAVQQFAVEAEGCDEVQVHPGSAPQLGGPTETRETDLDALLADPNIRRLLARHGVADHTLVSARRLRWRERRLEPGDRVRVIGVVRQQGRSHAYREAPAQPALWGGPGDSVGVQIQAG